MEPSRLRYDLIVLFCGWPSPPAAAAAGAKGARRVVHGCPALLPLFLPSLTQHESFANHFRNVCAQVLMNRRNFRICSHKSPFATAGSVLWSPLVPLVKIA